MSSKIQDVKSSIKAAERDLRDTLDSYVIPRANKWMQTVQIKKVIGLSECVKIANRQEQAACREENEQLYQQRFNSINQIMSKLQSNLDECLSSCKVDLSQEQGACYADCLKGAKSLCNQI